MQDKVEKKIELNLGGDIRNQLADIQRQLKKLNVYSNDNIKHLGIRKALLAKIDAEYKKQIENSSKQVKKTAEQAKNESAINDELKKRRADYDKWEKSRQQNVSKFTPVASMWNKQSYFDESISKEKEKRRSNTQEINRLMSENKRLVQQEGTEDIVASNQARIEALDAENMASQNKEVKLSDEAKTFALVVKDLRKITSLMIKPFKDLYSAVVSNVKSMIDLKTGMATFSSSSLVTNQAARETRLQYGLSAAQAYGFQTAGNLLNVRSEEDLMYMNQDQRNLFLQYMKQYSDWYTTMENSGVLRNVQEMQLQFSQFKQELSMEFLTWIADNKDVILNTMQGLLTVLMGISQTVLDILSKMKIGGTHESGSYTNQELYGNFDGLSGLISMNEGNI